MSSLPNTGAWRGTFGVPGSFSLLLWSALMVLPWLIPMHARPWTTFHNDASIATAAMLLAVWAVVVDRRHFRIPAAAVAVIALATVPLMQWALGLIRFAGDAWLPAIYLLGFAAAIAVGARAQQVRPAALPVALFASLGVAAMLSFALALYQWRDHDWLGVLVFNLPAGSRLAANVGQPNHLATLLVWGLLALWWAYLHQRARGVICTMGAALLLFGIAMTQSRTGVLEVLLLGLAALVFRRAMNARRSAVTLAMLGLWFLGAFVAWAPLNDALQMSEVQSLERRMAPGTRLLHWNLLVDAVLQRPWVGWGWNQLVVAQVALAPDHRASHEVIQYGHNLVLDLMIWNGIPIAMLVCGGLVAWFFWQFKHAVTAERALLLTAVAVFLLHAQLELPHGYALFLLPVGLMIGALHLAPADRWEFTIPRAAVALPFAALALCLAVVVKEYLQIEEAWMLHRMRAARIGSLVPTPVPQTVLLTNLQALLEFVRIEPRRDMSAAEIEQLRLMAQRQPNPGGLFRYAQAAALNGEIAQANATLDVLCRLHAEAQCTAAKAAWLAAADNDMPEMRTAWPTAY